jgi:hypothetical protein
VGSEKEWRYTEDGSVLRRIHVQPDDVGCLFLELRIVAGHVPLRGLLSARKLPENRPPDV